MSILQMINVGSFHFMISYQYCTTSRLWEMGMSSPFTPGKLCIIDFIGWAVEWHILSMFNRVSITTESIEVRKTPEKTCEGSNCVKDWSDTYNHHPTIDVAGGVGAIVLLLSRLVQSRRMWYRKLVRVNLASKSAAGLEAQNLTSICSRAKRYGFRHSFVVVPVGRGRVRHQNRQRFLNIILYI